VGRYTLDKQLTEAMIPMLNTAGFRAKLLTPEWATLWASVQKGTIPFYYMGRGSVQDPSAALHQYFHTGETPRIGYSNPKLDELLDKEQQEFDLETAPPVPGASDEHSDRRRAGVLPVAPRAALGPEQPHRL
jgi:peptide/nickel transport system substrate-binding protein